MTFGHYFKTAVKTLTAKGRRNGLKIMTLAVGLSVGLVLATKVCYENTFDKFIPGIDRLYCVNEAATQGGEYMVYPQTAGGIAPTMKEYFPQIDASTRFTVVASDNDLVVREGGSRVKTESIVLADSCFFQIFGRELLSGNVQDALTVSGNVAVSSDVALKLCSARDPKTAASQVLGTVFTVPALSPSVEFTVAAVYEVFPLNSSYRPDVLISMPTIGKLIYDGSMNLVGNDRYRTFIRLGSGVSFEDFEAEIPGYVQKYLPVEELKASGFDLSFILKPFADFHLDDESARNTNLVLALVAFALLLISALNYLLVVISTSVNRTREMALRKCLGSSHADMLKMMSAEALLHVLLAAAIAVVIIFSCGKLVENMTGVAPATLFTGTPLLLTLGILLLVLVLNSVVPARIFERIPIAAAFRNYRESRRVWKLGLLAVEFVAAAFLLVTVIVISRQYSKITSASLGFDTENLAQIYVEEADQPQRKLLNEKLGTLSCVESTSLSNSSPFSAQSGDNVSLPGKDEQLFNFRDFYWVNEDFFETMGLKFVEGRKFDENLNPEEEMIVDKAFADKIKNITGWESVVGHQLNVSGHSGGAVTVCGVIDQMQTAGFESSDLKLSRPLAIFYANSLYVNVFNYIFVRYKDMNEEALAETQALISETLPNVNIVLTPFSALIADGHAGTLRTRNSILIGSIVTLLIALLGLIGYTIDEVKRRSKEIAVRRVNGAQFYQIREMFLKSLMYIAVPSTAAGCILAGIVTRKWLQQFSVQTSLSWWIFLLSAVAVLLLISFVSDAYVRKTVGRNPAESIKTE